MTQDRRIKTHQQPTEPLVFTDAALIAAAQEHLRAESSAACLLHIPDTVPQLLVGVGTRDALHGLLRDEAAAPQAEAGKVEVPEGAAWAAANQRIVGPQWIAGWNECRLVAAAPATVPAELDERARVDTCMELAHRWAQAAYCKALGKPGEDIDSLKAQLRASLSAAAPERQEAEALTADQCERNAAFLEGKATECARQFGSTDTSTGFLYFKDPGHEEIYDELMGKAETYRAKALAAAPASAEPAQVPGELTVDRIKELAEGLYHSDYQDDAHGYDIALARRIEREVIARLAAPSSPSGEIGSVDTPELHRVAMNYRGASAEDVEQAWAALIAHIDQHTAQAVRAAREEALTDAEQAAEKIQDEYQRTQAHRYPEMRDDAESGAAACVYAIQQLKRTPQAAGTEQEPK